MEVTPKKRILLLITNRYAATNVIHSGLIKPLSEEFEVFILSNLISETDIRNINATFGIDTKGVNLPIPVETQWCKALRRLEKAIFFSHFNIETQAIKDLQEVSWRARFARMLPSITAILNLNKYLLRLIRSRILAIRLHDTSLDQLLSYHFDGVISSSPLDIRENLIVNSLKNHKISALATIISWDNLTSKGIINANHDYVLVWNQFMASEYRQFYSLFPDSSPKIAITGIPRFDIYFTEPTEGFSYSNFKKQFQLSDNDKVILFATSASVHFPNQAEIAHHLKEYASARSQVKVIIRCHFADVPSAYENLTRDSNIRLWTQENISKKHAEKMPEPDILESLAQMLRFCNVCVNVASTIRLETAICNKPGISIAYDGNSVMPFHKSVKRLYAYSHQKPLNKAKIDFMVFSKESLFEFLDQILSNSSTKYNYLRSIQEFIYEPAPTAVANTMKYIREWQR